MSSNFIVFLRNKDGYPVAQTFNQIDCACYHEVKHQIWQIIQNGYKPLHPFQYEKYIQSGVDARSINLKLIAAESNIPYDAMLCVPLNKQLIRVYFKKEHFGNHVTGLHSSCLSTNPLPLGDDEVSVGGYINPRFVSQYFKDTLRLIPEFKGCIGPDNDPFSCDILLGRTKVPQSFLLMWLCRRLDEDVNGFIVSNVVITARALASIQPGLAYFYLLSLESSWLGGVTDDLLGMKRLGPPPRRLVTFVIPDPATPWSVNINHTTFIESRNYMHRQHSLNTFTPECANYKTECALSLTHTKAIINKGKLPPSIGDRSYFKRIKTGKLKDTDSTYELVSRITSHKGLKHSPKGYEPKSGAMKMIHLGLFPDQVELAYQEMHQFGCIKNSEVLNQLNNVVESIARKPINYFIKGWTADE